MGEAVYAIIGLVVLQLLQCAQLAMILRTVRRSTLRPPPPVGRIELQPPLELERPTPWQRVVESVRPTIKRRRRRTLDDSDPER